MNPVQPNTPVSPAQAVDLIEQIDGKHKGCRRAHAKGIGFNAVFAPNGNAAPFTQAAFLQNETIEAAVRFSHSSPSPNPSERLMPIKGMSVQFTIDNQPSVSLVMANVPVFPTKTPEAFIRLLKTVGGSNRSLKETVETLKDDIEFSTLPALLKRLKTPASFASTRYWAIHAYFLDTDSTDRQAVRFSWEPVSDEHPLSFPTKDMEAELLNRIETSSVQFRLLMTIGTEEDPTHDPSISWPDSRAVVDVGVLTLVAKRTDNAEFLLFDPTVEVPGFRCSDDPVLHYRSPVYHESFRRRTSESKKQ